MVVLGLLVLIVGMFLWSRHTAQGFTWQNGDVGMLGVFGVLLLFDIFLILGMGRELKRPSGNRKD